MVAGVSPIFNFLAAEAKKRPPFSVLRWNWAFLIPRNPFNPDPHMGFIDKERLDQD